MQADFDLAVRLAAFAWLSEQTAALGDVLPYELLKQGFHYAGNRMSLVSPQGIHKPRQLDLPLSITTVADGPYDDVFGPDNLLRYHYRGSDPNHRDNAGLRRAHEQQKPLIYFCGIVPGRYLAIWPVYIVADHPRDLSFSVAVDEVGNISYDAQPARAIAERSDARRAYLTTTIRARLHQRLFRERVLEAYRTQCAMCRLRHRELLDAAHIRPDSTPQGNPVINNGLALCKLHHAAFDSFILGVTPDYVIQVRPDVLEESDGPILQHGLQELHGVKLWVPLASILQPDREALDWRFQQFIEAANRSS